MHARPYLTLLLPVLLCVAALGAAAMAAQPAAAGPVTGTVTDQYQNPLGGMLVEALDPATELPIADASAKTDGTGLHRRGRLHADAHVLRCPHLRPRRSLHNHLLQRQWDVRRGLFFACS